MKLGLHPFQGNSPLRISPAHILTAQKSPAENGSAGGWEVDTSGKRNGCNKSYIRGRCWVGVREREQIHVRPYLAYSTQTVDAVESLAASAGTTGS
jgi:hypothetical protein